MSADDNSHGNLAAYREAYFLLVRALALLDSVGDSLAAAQLSNVIELIQAKIGPDPR